MVYPPLVVTEPPLPLHPQLPSSIHREVVPQPGGVQERVWYCSVAAQPPAPQPWFAQPLQVKPQVAQSAVHWDSA